MWKPLQTIIFILCFAFCLAGCGKDSRTSSNRPAPANDTQEEFSYQASFLEVDSGLDKISACCIQEDAIYLLGNKYAENKNKSFLLICNQDGSIRSKKFLKKLKDTETPIRFLEDEQSRLYLLTKKETAYYLHALNKQGAITKTVKLQSEQELYLDSSVSSVIFHGNLYLAAANGVYSFNKKGRQEKTYFIPKSTIKNLFLTSSGKLYAYAFDTYHIDTDAFFAEYDEETDSFQKLSDIKGYRSDSISILPKDGETVYIGDRTGISSLAFPSGSPEKIFGWIDCGIAEDSVDGWRLLEDGKFFAVKSPELNDKTGQYNPSFITVEKKPAADPEAKKTLTIAATGLSQELTEAILSFNRSNQKLRMKVTDYSAYTDPKNRLNLDLSSGKIPDIISLTRLDSDTMDILLKDHVLTDLYPLMETDPEVKKEAFLPSVLQSMETDGKLYAMGSTFDLSFYLAGKNIVGDRESWTVDEMLDSLQKLPEDATFSLFSDSRETFLDFAFGINFKNYIDWDTKKAHFTSDSFLKILNYARELAPTRPPKDGESFLNYAPVYPEEIRTLLKEKKALIQQKTISMFSFLSADMDLYQDAGGASIISPPSDDGRDNSVQISMRTLSITEECRDKEAAWEFVRSFFTYDYQIEKAFYGEQLLPVRQDVFDKCLEYFMAKEDYKDKNFYQNKEDNSSYVFSLPEPWTEEDAAVYKNLISRIDSCLIMSGFCDKISSLINEETEAFYAGDKTAEETAEIIQNRVQLLLDESR